MDLAETYQDERMTVGPQYWVSGQVPDFPFSGNTHGMTIIELLFVMAIIGLLAAIAVPNFQIFLEQARVTRAIGDIKAIQADIDGFATAADTLPTSLASIGRSALLDPWGSPYQYLNFSTTPGNGVPNGARRDRFLVPINSTYDLYSLGKDGSSAPSLQASASKDDVVRANDSSYVGRASLY